MAKPSAEFAAAAARIGARHKNHLPANPRKSPAAGGAECANPVPQETPAPKRGFFSNLFGGSRG